MMIVQCDVNLSTAFDLLFFVQPFVCLASN